MVFASCSLLRCFVRAVGLLDGNLLVADDVDALLGAAYASTAEVVDGSVGLGGGCDGADAYLFGL